METKKKTYSSIEVGKKLLLSWSNGKKKIENNKFAWQSVALIKFKWKKKYNLNGPYLFTLRLAIGWFYSYNISE